MNQSRSRVAVSFDFQLTLTGGLLLVQALVRSDFGALHGVSSDPLIWQHHPAYDCWRLEVFSALFERLLVTGGGLFNRELKVLMLENAFKFVDRVWFHVAVTNFRSQRATENVGATLSHHVVRESGGVTAEFIH